MPEPAMPTMCTRLASGRLASGGTRFVYFEPGILGDRRPARDVQQQPDGDQRDHRRRSAERDQWERYSRVWQRVGHDRDVDQRLDGQYTRESGRKQPTKGVGGAPGYQKAAPG